MPHFIKEINTESEEFEIFLNDEEYYAWITQEPKYIEFLKRTNQYTEEKNRSSKNENNRTKKNNQKIQNRNKKIYQ